ncbi:hypothetical protein LMH87_011729 [Akanthomyces muscarius]|uniref:Stress activated map kinase interacting n=1 Tax=Akanthomyces muscarius TaxID=2231603 RepID=A0A9W8UIQ3_AKAMU|nr:hypothetical protein LMH87_011729 [Akanthomyces muscarius]KAJ4151008.1 hypothetical protein LMH87_011729 [Akanthomyces muscarius]
MGLVDYSESESSGSEAEAAPTKQIAKPRFGAASKKIPSVVDKSKSGKIIVNLAGTATDASSSTPSDEPPAKRARTAGSGRFSGFNSFLPAPKNAATAGGAKAKPGFGGLRTSAAPGFSRDTGAPSIAESPITPGDGDAEALAGPKSSGLSLPPPRNAAAAEPSIPEGQKPAAEVKLTGKPLMFRPLSVAKGKKKTSTAAPRPKPAEAPPAAAAPAPEPPRKKVSLFSIPTDDTVPALGPSLSSGTGAYEPLFETGYSDDYSAAYAAQAAAEPVAESVGDIADDMNLSAAARRELFGRAGASDRSHVAAQRVVNFNMDREYRHNEALRASGEQQTHNPVRSIQGGGKHSLRQLVGNVQGQKDALEDSFAKGRSNRKEASSRYGW